MHGLYKLFYNMCCNSDKLAYKSKYFLLMESITKLKLSWAFFILQRNVINCNVQTIWRLVPLCHFNILSRLDDK
jgi:hypothetical protein